MRISTVGPNYSLIEVLAVLLVIGLAVGLALPRFGRLPAAWRVRRVRTQLQTAADRAASLALAEGRTVRLHWDAAAHAPRLLPDGAPPPPDRQAPLEPDAVPVGTPADILFLPTGEAAGAPWQFALAGHRVVLTVDPLTAAVTLAEAAP